MGGIGVGVVVVVGVVSRNRDIWNRDKELVIMFIFFGIWLYKIMKLLMVDI